MFFLFSFLFFSCFLFCSVCSVFLMDYSSLSFEILVPYSILTEVPLVLTFDYISLTFFASVSVIASMVFYYSSFYMDSPASDTSNNNTRFFYLLFLFVLSMMFLVFSGSWATVMLGWDGLGLVSFLLVVYYNNSSSLDSGLITVFTNRVGDCLFILSFIFMFYSGWVSLDFISFSFSIFFCLILFFGCITKSAQIPFSSWLPAAMAAPTPVSSLVHSSTLVTAGVYLLIRFNFLFVSVFYYMCFISLCTMFIAGLCACYELDFKKVVAMSTLSQLGFMIFSISMGYWLLSFLHMVFHAFFKSSLFLSTGSLMHFLLGDQDSRKFGSMGSSGFSKLFFSMSSLSLMGFPFSLGFYSKDSILGETLHSEFSFISFLFFLSCCFTVAYSFRLIYMAFFSFPSLESNISFSDDSRFFVPVLLLYTFCVFLGNYFFFYYISPVVFSFLEFSGGIFIIILGISFFLFFNSNYFVSNFLSTISFISLLTSSFASSTMDKFSYVGEYTWAEVLGGKGSSSVLTFFNLYNIRLYALKLSSVVLLVSVLFILVL